MPSQKLVELVPKRVFTQEKWIALAEERRAMIKPFLPRFTLKRLGKVQCVRKGKYSTGALEDDRPLVEPGGIASGLNTEGVWNKCYPVTMLKASWSGTWGLSRSGAWILVKLNIMRDLKDERVYKVGVHEVELLELINALGVEPCQVWGRLAEQVHEWEFEHNRLYESLEHLHSTFREDSTLIHYLST